MVKLDGYGEKSWKPAINMDDLQAINLFHAEQPGKPGS
jgi:hypothetical protein